MRDLSKDEKGMTILASAVGRAARDASRVFESTEDMPMSMRVEMTAGSFVLCLLKEIQKYQIKS